MSVSSIIRGNRATLKLLFVGFLSLVMLIPLVMISSIIEDRQDMQSSAEQTIAQRWGGNQVVTGLLQLKQIPVEFKVDEGVRMRKIWHANTVSDLKIEASLTTEQRYLGIYEVPVYTTTINISGRLEPGAVDRIKEAGEAVLFWLPLGDVRGVREISGLKIGQLEVPAKPLSVAVNQHQGLQFAIPPEDLKRLGDEYHLTLKLAGSCSLLFLPMADTTEVRLSADWPHPEFIGQFLPMERAISAVGSEARWKLLGLNRPYGNQFSLADLAPFQLNQAGFGLRLETPVDAYQRSERSVKYGALFISLTFFILFLFEVMTGKPLHPVPYVLTGAALAVFYLLLLALSEFLSFAGAFVIASLALVFIVTLYTGVVLGKRSRGYLVGAMMGLIYVLLYVLISAQYASLLLGAVALLAAIAALMYLTRRIDWYAYKEK